MLSIDFDKAHRQANAVGQVARGILEQCRKFEMIADELPLVWSGRTAAAYKAELETFIALLKQNAKACSAVSDDYTAKIDMIAETEEENAALLEA